MTSCPRSMLFAGLLLGTLGASGPLSGQGSPDRPGSDEALSEAHPELYGLLTSLEAAQGILFGELASRAGSRDRTRSDVPPTEAQAALVDRLSGLLRSPVTGQVAADAERGFGALGERAADVLRWGRGFRRSVISILSDTGIEDREAALEAELVRYGSRPDVALPRRPKDMGVLYDHAYALSFRTEWPDLDGLVWAGHWLRLAATEPLTDLDDDAERAAGLDTVMARFSDKLSFGEPPQAFPSQLPLAPAIAPGLIWLSPEAAMVWDNLSMLEEVLADVLSGADPADVEVAVGASLDFFLDPELAMTDRDEWEIMALRHGIFFQGGYPLALMTGNERNADPHAAHLKGGSMVSIPGMPRH